MATLFNEAAQELAIDDKLSESKQACDVFAFYVHEVDGFRYVHRLDNWDDLMIGYQSRLDFANREIQIILAQVDTQDLRKPLLNHVETMVAYFDITGALSTSPLTDALKDVCDTMFEEIFPEQFTTPLAKQLELNPVNSDNHLEKGQRSWEISAGELGQVISSIEVFYSEKNITVDKIEVNQYLPYLV